jgi:hypothetical protein
VQSYLSTVPFSIEPPESSFAESVRAIDLPFRKCAVEGPPVSNETSLKFSSNRKQAGTNEKETKGRVVSGKGDYHVRATRRNGPTG